MRQRDNTKWRPVLLTNVKYVVTLTNFPLGCPDVEMPDHIKAKKCVLSFTHNAQDGEEYEDNLCMFRCLSFHISKKRKVSERLAKRLCQKWLNHKKSSVSLINIKGVRLSQIPEFEKPFEVNINIFELKEINGKKNYEFESF